MRAELHDTLLQTIQGSKMVADRALRSADDHERMVKAVERLSAWLGQTASEGHAVLSSLRASTGDLRSSEDERGGCGLLRHSDAGPVECEGQTRLTFQPRPLEWVVGTALDHV